MNDSMYEQLIARKTRITDYVVRAAIILVIILIVILGPLLIGFTSWFLALVLALLATFFIFPKLKVEYEYILLNHDMQIDIIYNRQKRKTMIEFDLLRAEKIVPIDSQNAASFHTEKTYDFTSGSNPQNVYAILINIKSQKACVLLEPDETMKMHISNWAGSHLQTP